jgi:hypothetical protein
MESISTFGRWPGWVIIALAGVLGCPNGGGGPDSDIDVADDADGEPDVDGDPDTSGLPDANDDADLESDGGGPVDGDADLDMDSASDVELDADEWEADADIEPEEVLPPPASAIIGAAGGEVSLENGITLTVPPGAVAEDTEITLVPVYRERSPWEDEGWLRHLCAFRVEPELFHEEGFVFWIPADGLPDGASGEDIRLIPSSEGSTDGPGHGGLSRIHPVWFPEESDESGASFRQVSTASAALLQPLIETSFLGSEPPVPGTGGLKGPPPAGTTLGQSCARVLQDAGAPIDPIELSRTLAVFSAMNDEVTDRLSELAGGDSMSFVEAVNRFHLRVCWAAYQSLEFYRNEMELPFPRAWMHITLSWEERAGIGICGDIAGRANGFGVVIYFNHGCSEDYLGFYDAVPWSGAPSSGTSGWNVPFSVGESYDTVADNLESVVAHEVFHFVHDWADRQAGQFASLSLHDNALTEGGAVAAAEAAYDTPGSGNNPLLLNMVAPDPAAGGPSIWDINYTAHPLWRFIDWTQSDPFGPSVLQRMLQYLWDYSSPGSPLSDISWTAFDEILSEMFSERPSYDRDQLFADFAASYLYFHDFERFTGEGDPSDPASFDRTPDIHGIMASEEGQGQMWGSWDVGVQPSLDSYTRATTWNPTKVPDRSDPPLTVELRQGTANMVDLMLSDLFSGGDRSCVRLRVEAQNSLSDRRSHVALRLIHHRDARTDLPRAETVWRANQISTNEQALSFRLIPEEMATEGELVVVLANVGEGGPESDVRVILHVDRPRESIAVLGRDRWIGGLALFDVPAPPGEPVQRSVTMASPDLVSLDGVPHFVAPGGGSQVFVSQAYGWVSKVETRRGSEREIDWDGNPATGDPGLPAGMSRLQLGDRSEPRGIAVLLTRPRGLVATADGVVLFDQSSTATLGVLTNATMSLSPLTRPYDIVLTPDETKAYVSIYDPIHQDSNEGEVLVLDVARLLGGTFDSSVVTNRIYPMGGNFQFLAMSHNGEMVAVTVVSHGTVRIISTRTERNLDVGGDGPPSELDVPIPWLPSARPQAVAWDDDDSAVYVGYAGGYPGGALEAYGTVRRCPIALGHCRHEVGVGAPSGVGTGVRSLSLAGCGAQRTVVVANGEGRLTFLSEDLFEPGPDTSGTDPFHAFDGTGGCLDDWGGYAHAITCSDLAIPPQLARVLPDLVSQPAAGCARIFSD